MLAAGNTIYLASSSPIPSLRGLLVEVGGTGGTVTNGTASNSSATTPEQLVGQILASDGNVTLAGLAVNQLGRVSATTSINENGSIYLQAGGSRQHHAIRRRRRERHAAEPATGGQLVLGANSDTEVTLDSTDPRPRSTACRSCPPRSRCRATACRSCRAASPGRPAAPSTSRAAQTPGRADAARRPDGSRVYVAPGAELDVSGANIVLPVSSNVIPVQLRGTELANSPLQQNGPLRSQTVYVDIRTGTPLAEHQRRDRRHRLQRGRAQSDRRHDHDQFARRCHSRAGLDRRCGRRLDPVHRRLLQHHRSAHDHRARSSTSARPIRTCCTRASPTPRPLSDPKWGTSTTYQALQPVYSPGYIEGKNGGTLQLSAPQFVLDSTVDAGVQSGLYQRNPDTAVTAPIRRTTTTPTSPTTRCRSRPR